MKRRNVVVGIVAALLASIVTLSVRLYEARDESRDLQEKAAQRDRICARAKEVLIANEREIRRGGPLRDVVIGRFGQEDRLDGVTVLGLCAARGARLEDFNACAEGGQDYACLADFMASVARDVR